jgi:Histone methylation protein DOT1
MAPSRRERASAAGDRSAFAPVVTPGTGIVVSDQEPLTESRALGARQKSDSDERGGVTTRSPRRVLFGASPRRSSARARSTGRGNAEFTSGSAAAVAVTPSPPLKTAQKRKDTSEIENEEEVVATASLQPSAKRRLLFGRYVNMIECSPNVQVVYKIVHKLTGNIGGNGYSGPIYGELTMHSMQKMINLMVKATGLNKDSRFIDVGSGIGKPNLHVAQDPGVAFSCGVEMEHTRWVLGMTCLKACLDAAVTQRQEDIDNENDWIQGNTMFLHKNITEATTFDPFTHVYMFSIGFPPELWLKLSEQWNKSDPNVCQYLICYHGPRDIIYEYEFEVELVAQTPTSMHGSKEGHMGYIYRRTTGGGGSICSPARVNATTLVACDPLFQSSFQLVKDGLHPLQREVNRQMVEFMGDEGRTTRSRQRQRLTRN